MEAEDATRKEIEQIISLNVQLRRFWTNAKGWAPEEAERVIVRARLDWQVSLSRCLALWITEPNPDEADGRLILAWANLGSLVEGSMKLFLSIYYKDYIDDVAVRRNNKGKIEPDRLWLESMRTFFKERVWIKGGEEWDEWILHIQNRRNAIHSFRDRDIGTLSEFRSDVERYREFLEYLISREPYPEDIYRPR